MFLLTCCVNFWYVMSRAAYLLGWYDLLSPSNKELHDLPNPWTHLNISWYWSSHTPKVFSLLFASSLSSTKNLTLLLHGRVSIFYLLQLRFKTFQTWCFTGWWPYRWRGSSDHYASLLICLILNPAEVDSFSIKCCLERTKNEPGVGPFFEKIRFKAVVMIKFSACSSSTLIIWFWIPQKPTTFIQKCCWKTRK